MELRPMGDLKGSLYPEPYRAPRREITGNLEVKTGEKPCPLEGHMAPQ